MKKYEKITFLICGILFIYCIVGIIHTQRECDNACKELGFETQTYSLGMDYCEDVEGNLHYAKIDCKHWYWADCTAKLISVGDVRTIT